MYLFNYFDDLLTGANGQSLKFIWQYEIYWQVVQCILMCISQTQERYNHPLQEVTNATSILMQNAMKGSGLCRILHFFVCEQDGV